MLKSQIWIYVLQTLTPEQLGEVKAHKRKGPPTNICKWLECPVTDPADWKQEVLHQFGAGTYHFILNDTRFNEAAGTRASGGAAIARADTGDLGDCETYPPVLNYDHSDRAMTPTLRISAGVGPRASG